MLAAVLFSASEVFGEEGWIDLFDGETLFGWKPMGVLEWQVDGGVASCRHVKNACGWLATTSVFADFELSAGLRVDDGGAMGLVVRSALEGHPSENGASLVTLTAPEGGKAVFHEVRVIASGDSVMATVDGQEVDVARGGAACGHVGLLYYGSGRVAMEAMRLKPLNMQPIFNRENLEGWNILPGHASEFTVVDGTLNIKNGNGQIETDGEYKDFILQLSVYSNGEHLNSGVFFRGPKGVFWKGYESQVRNQWSRDDRTRPVDYGTGGIYGDQEARKVVSNDKEWFEKTIVCNGNHMAVWVNGYQTSDWLDVRPVAEDGNAKEGYVPGPGTIHLQGHDPTTDLSFTNIRIQEYPAR